VIVRRHNIIEEDMPDDFPAIAVAAIDVDLHEAVLAALRKVSPKMVPGGVVIVEDPATRHNW
jgi:Macrocin-O-methyltransferase (TylF)